MSFLQMLRDKLESFGSAVWSDLSPVLSLSSQIGPQARVRWVALMRTLMRMFLMYLEDPYPSYFRPGAGAAYEISV